MRKSKFDIKIWGIALLMLAAVLAASCSTINGPQNGKDDDSAYPRNQGKEDETTVSMQSSDQLKRFSSGQEIIDYLKTSSMSQNDAYNLKGVRTMGGIAEGMGADVAPVFAPSMEQKSSAASEYSATNVQVAGVDEADFVKNDDKYVYEITQNNLIIVDAYPAENAKIASQTKVKGMPREMFVNKDRLVVFSDDNGEEPIIEQYDFMPRPRYVSRTHAIIYDISDRSNPKIVKDYNLNGYYLSSRMIDKHVYFIVQENVYYYNRYIDLPVIMQGSKTVLRPEIYYFDNPDNNYNFNTVASFDVFADGDDVNAKTYMMGYANTIYASLDNIYITYQKNYPYLYYESHNEDRFYNVIVPLLPGDAQAKIKAHKGDSQLTAYQKWERISSELEDMYKSMGKDDSENLIQKISDAVADYESKLEIERRKTVIHKIKIDKGAIDYATKGEVPGYLLNQFSMDEHEGNFRVATTMEFYGITPAGIEYPQTEEGTKAAGAEGKSMPIRQRYNVYSNVYVLDKDLKIAGKIEGIAPEERIYSTRFIGDRLYMVTFKRIDPLFVIDLSRPAAPKILGKLKIPGFSDYLHPYDGNHIIGVGKETGTNEWGGVSTKGVKLAIFDVSDVNNPKEVDKYEIGEAGTDSEALREHKAFLFDKTKNILVIPVTEVKGKQYYDPRAGYYRLRFWQGAYVFGLTPEKGFELKGKITHNEFDDRLDYYYYGSPDAVRRALYMDDVLYTVSLGKIKANSMEDISKEIKEIELPYEKEVYHPYQY